MNTNNLYSALLELRAMNESAVPVTMGHLAHALFLNLVKQFNPGLSARLHDRPGNRPFTISPLRGAPRQGDNFMLQREQFCSLRITLLDGGDIWQRLTTHFLEAGPIQVHLGPASLQLVRMLSSAASDHTGWVGTTDWETLAGIPASRLITMRFASPTAFSMGNRQFELFPKPLLVWESLQRVWNSFAPDRFKTEKHGIQEFLRRKVEVKACDLHIETCHFPKYIQKGFVGTCTYQVQEEGPNAAQLSSLAAFARYAGVGCKTPQGMGQAQAEMDKTAPR